MLTFFFGVWEQGVGGGDRDKKYEVWKIALMVDFDVYYVCVCVCVCVCEDITCMILEYSGQYCLLK